MSAIPAAPNTVVKGNLIGLNAAGTRGPARGRLRTAASTSASERRSIGGPTAADRNVISGHPQSGVVIGYTVGGTAAQGTIEGNYIGTDVTGTLPIPNTTGVFIPQLELCRAEQRHRGATRNTGSTPKAAPTTSSRATSSAPTRPATLDLGNGDGGIVIGGTNWTIGGTGAGQGNVIAHNGAPYGGIVNGGYQMARIRAQPHLRQRAPSGSTCTPAVRGGVTPNDAGDGDTGPNGLQNYPI